MSIAKMSLVNIVGNMDVLDETMDILMNKIDFHPESASFLSRDMSDAAQYENENSYNEALNMLVDIAAKNAIKLKYSDYSDIGISDINLHKYVFDLHAKIEQLTDKKITLNDSIKQYNQALEQLNHIMSLKANFEELFSCKYIKIRFGRLPIENYEKLTYYESNTFLFIPFDTDNEYCWGVYFSPRTKSAENDAIFSSLYFERMRVPDYAQGTPKETYDIVVYELEQEKQKLTNVEKELSDLISKEKKTILKVYSKLKFQTETFMFRKYIAVIEENFHIIGYIQQCDEAKLKKEIAKLDDTELVFKPAKSDSRFEPPVKLKNSKLFKPFETFVSMYGLPSYGDIDPTTFVATTYIILFGLMFGDLGQGIVISLLGYLMYRMKKMQLGKILIRCGVSSAFFGTVYGSVFGFEHLLDPMYQKVFGLEHKPIEVLSPDMITNILIGAVGLGAVIIMISIFINIILGFKQKNYERAIFSNNGIAGFLFYGSILAYAVLKLLLNIDIMNPIFLILCIVAPLLCMFFRTPLSNLLSGKKSHEKHTVGEFITENFFELFEFLLSYVTNTMSFLRVGGFILSHAGMMLVVMTLAELVGSGASPIVLIIGNIFVMAMEGLIVGIQALRLEFYEIFSRFYDGDGKPFEPFKVEYEIND